ncbi:hypothetical protein U9M48_017149 [Paspalum notatum var. saurae]|uniref:Uncharacterized protein n=1 Tax=Paspalum notatum var. saurae TaxID=547442 RepID=A0AAQ3T7Y9_PASNO
MRDWAPSIIATALFALLCPGGVLQMPGRQRPVDLMNMRTSFPSMLVHALPSLDNNELKGDSEASHYLDLTTVTGHDACDNT